MSLTLVTGDIHCGQTYEQYGSTAVERVENADHNLEKLARFQQDYQNRIGRVIIAGDLCQRTGRRGRSEELEQEQLAAVGRGLQEHDAEIVYLAGSADPYHDETTMGMCPSQYKHYLAQHMRIDEERLQLPGLTWKHLNTNHIMLATHGHLADVLKNKQEYRNCLLNPDMVAQRSADEQWLQRLRETEERHQQKGMAYEWLHTLLQKLPDGMGTSLDAFAKDWSYKDAWCNIHQLGLPDGATYIYGHNHVPMNTQLPNKVTAVNPGSAVGAFRMNPQEVGSFATLNAGTHNTTMWQTDVDEGYAPKKNA